MERSSSSQRSPCPVCKRNLPLLMLPVHIDTCLSKISPPLASSSSKKRKCADKQANCESSLIGKRIKTGQSTGKNVNAFVELMTRATEKQRREIFCLHVEDGKWNCYWLPGTAPMVCTNTWSTETAISTQDATLLRKGTLTIMTNMDSAARTGGLMPKVSNLPLSVVKSALQKNIRRRRPIQAAKCAFWLMRKSFTDFIRRFPIIILEDGILHPCYPHVIWFMIADSKGYIPSQSQCTFLLTLVIQVAECNIRDPLPDFSVEEERKMNKIGTIDCDKLDPQIAMFVRAILCRARYGGMVGDVKMLVGYAYIWLERFCGERKMPDAICRSDIFLSKEIRNLDTENPINWAYFIQHIHGLKVGQAIQTITAAELNNMGLGREDIPLSAVDFHCVPKIIEEIATLLQRQDTAKGSSQVRSCPLLQCGDLHKRLKRAMWLFSSSVNHKLCLVTVRRATCGAIEDRKRLLPLWTKSQNLAIKFARKYIDFRVPL